MPIREDQKNKIVRLYLSGKGYIKLSKHFGIPRTTIQKFIRKNGISRPDRAPKSKFENVDVENLYKQGFGVLKISKKLNVNVSSVYRRLKKIGIIDSSRQFKKADGSRRSRRTNRHEFTDSIKKNKFKQVEGICELCNTIIEDALNWRLVTYHHKILVSNGGDGSYGNCMVLHSSCHKEKFYELHGFSYQKLNNYKKINRKRKENNNKQMILYLFNKGVIISEIAKIIGITSSSVRWHLKKLIEDKFISKKNWNERSIGSSLKVTDDQILNLRNLKVSEIVKTLNVTERAIYYRLNKIPL